MNLALGLVFSGLIGLSLGLIGGGGSIITVPILVYILGIEASEAVGMSLCIVGGTSLISAFLHHKQGVVQLKEGLIFGIAGILGAFIGAPLTNFFSSTTLMLIFAILMVTSAIAMLSRKQKETEEIKETNNISFSKALLSGFGVGVLTGFLGVGGGFLIVPALHMFGGLGMREAIGTSLFVIFLNCIAGLLAHINQSSFPFYLTLLVTSSAIIGTILGTVLSHRISTKKLQKGFAILVLIIGVIIIAKNYNVLF